MLHALALLTFVLALAALFALVEIAIEGGAGWAGNLPTWRRTAEEWPWLKLLWGGRDMTGYHATVFPFISLLFHLPLVFSWSFTLWMEIRVLGLLAVFWVVEDFLWFVLNPAFPMRDFRQGERLWWHKRWFLGLPVDYWMFLPVALVGYFASF